MKIVSPLLEISANSFRTFRAKRCKMWRGSTGAVAGAWGKGEMTPLGDISGGVTPGSLSPGSELMFSSLLQSSTISCLVSDGRAMGGWNQAGTTLVLTSRPGISLQSSDLLRLACGQDWSSSVSSRLLLLMLPGAAVSLSEEVQPDHCFLCDHVTHYQS